MPPKDKYTDPKLRDEIKEELHKSDKGGAPGQWSARKAQMMASEYKKRGGDYNTDKSEKDESQKHLDNWGEEDWQTKEGSGNAKQEDGSQKRYLPKKAWENMSEKEKEETDDKKQKESKQGKQYVQNTIKAKESRKEATQDDHSPKKGKQSNGQSKSKKDEKIENEDEDEDGTEEDQEDEQDQDSEQEDEDEEIGDEEKGKPGQKRGRNEAKSSSKKQKANSGQAKSKDDGDSNQTIGSKHMSANEPGKQGSAERLPKTGQTVHWKAMPGWVDGKLERVLKNDEQVDGKSVKASEKDPRFVLKSNASGKICVHKPDACYYD